MKRDTETDWLLLRLRAHFNLCEYALLAEHALLMADWLEERGRPEEAQLLRSHRYSIKILEGEGWPPPCRVTASGDCLGPGSTYFDSGWLTTAELLANIEHDPASGAQDCDLLWRFAEAIRWRFPSGDQGDRREGQS